MAKQTAWGKLLWDWHLAAQEHEQLCLFSQNPVFLRDCLLAFLAPGGAAVCTAEKALPIVFFSDSKWG